MSVYTLLLGSDQELHADAAEGCGILPHPLHYAQGEAVHTDAMTLCMCTPVALNTLVCSLHCRWNSGSGVMLQQQNLVFLYTLRPILMQSER